MSTAIRSLAQAFDAIYDDARAKVGDDDLAHIRKVDAYSKAIEARGRELIRTGRTREELKRGVLLRALHIVLEFSELGHNIMHGGYDHLPNAGEYHSERFRWALAVDPEEWKLMHHVNHHPKTGIVGQDHDLGFSAVRLFPGQDWYAHHVAQPAILLAFLFSSPALFATYTASSAVRVEGKRVLRKATFDKAREGLRRLLKQELLSLPLRSGFRAPFAGPLYMASQLLGYDLTGFMLIIEHHAPNVEVFTDPGPNETRDAYYERQLRGTTNFTPYLPLEKVCRQVLEEEVDFEDPPAFEVFYGGLDTHLEHHLFPDLPCNRQREVRPLVRRVCAEFDIPYNTMPIEESLPAVVKKLFPFAGPLAEGERAYALARQPGRVLRRIADGVRYRNPSVDRYMKKPRYFNALATVKEVADLAKGEAAHIRMQRPHGWEEQTWPPGAFISLRVQIDGESFVRQYSLLESKPGCDVEITIRRVKDGKVSNHLCDHIGEGDRLVLVAPPSHRGGLTQQTPPSHALYIAAGVGITPILSMVRRHQRIANADTATLLYWNRSKESALFTEELERLAEDPRLTLVNYYSEEGAPRLSAKLLKPHLGGHPDVYACAPSAMLTTLQKLLTRAGVPESDQHFEQFVAPDLARRAPSGRTHLVRFASSGRELMVDESTTLLEAARDAGLAPPAGCERGLCRACACTRLSGATEAEDVESDGRARITICNAFPRGPVDLEL